MNKLKILSVDDAMIIGIARSYPEVARKIIEEFGISKDAAKIVKKILNNKDEKSLDNREI